MSTVNPVNVPVTSNETAFKGKKEFLKKLVEKKIPCPPSGDVSTAQKFIDDFHNPINRAIREGRPKAEINELVMRDIISNLSTLSKMTKEELSKLAAKNGYKGV